MCYYCCILCRLASHSLAVVLHDRHVCVSGWHDVPNQSGLAERPAAGLDGIGSSAAALLDIQCLAPGTTPCARVERDGEEEHERDEQEDLEDESANDPTPLTVPALTTSIQETAMRFLTIEQCAKVCVLSPQSTGATRAVTADAPMSMRRKLEGGVSDATRRHQCEGENARGARSVRVALPLVSRARRRLRTIPAQCETAKNSILSPRPSSK